MLGKVRKGDYRKECDKMTETIIFAASIIAVAIGWSTPNTYDYHTDLRNIAYQLSRIADALNRKEGAKDD